MPFCTHCASEIDHNHRFCSNCGNACVHVAGPTINGSVTGPVIGSVGGSIGSISIGTAHDSAPQPLTREPVWSSNLTQARLGWFSAIAAVPTVGSFVGTVATSVSSALDRTPSVHPGLLLTVTGAFGLIFVLTFLAYRTVKLGETRPLSRFHWLPAVSGADGTLALVRLTGKCPHCRGTLRLRNVNLGSKDHPCWAPYAVCSANSEQHRWHFDTTALAE